MGKQMFRLTITYFRKNFLGERFYAITLFNIAGMMNGAFEV